jgi:hypothetical protein
MLRENLDVIEVFFENILGYIFDYRHMDSLQMVEAIVHYMFYDLTSADQNQKLIFIIYHLTMKSFP